MYKFSTFCPVAFPAAPGPGTWVGPSCPAPVNTSACVSGSVDGRQSVPGRPHDAPPEPERDVEPSQHLALLSRWTVGVSLLR